MNAATRASELPQVRLVSTTTTALTERLLPELREECDTEQATVSSTALDTTKQRSDELVVDFERVVTGVGTLSCGLFEANASGAAGFELRRSRRSENSRLVAPALRSLEQRR